MTKSAAGGIELQDAAEDGTASPATTAELGGATPRRLRPIAPARAAVLNAHAYAQRQAALAPPPRRKLITPQEAVPLNEEALVQREAARRIFARFDNKAARETALRFKKPVVGGKGKSWAR